MEQHHSGSNITGEEAKIKVFQEEIEEWQNFDDAYLQEGKRYKIRILQEDIDSISLNNTKLYSREMGNNEIIELPVFESSGIVEFIIKYKEQQEVVESYIYPDERKVTLQQYEVMIKEILEEVNTCFQFTGLNNNFEVANFSIATNFAQWDYIERNIYKLRNIFYKISANPVREIRNSEQLIPINKIGRISTETERWVEKNIDKYELDESGLPNLIKVFNPIETYDIFENRILKKQLLELYKLLKKYEYMNIESVAAKARAYSNWVQKCLGSKFVGKVTISNEKVKVTEIFKKHLFYRQWYSWFSELYKTDSIRIGFDIPMPIKNTYLLYEIWCYIRIIKQLREMDLVVDTTDLYKLKNNGIFINLSRGKESVIKLKKDIKLFYQRVFKSNTSPYYSFPHQMIPDIVIELSDKLFIFDPKYRHESHLAEATSEMHKYKNGIKKQGTNVQVVEVAFIIAPRKGEDREGLFEESSYKIHQMGAFLFKPGCDIDSNFKNYVEQLLL